MHAALSYLVAELLVLRAVALCEQIGEQLPQHVDSARVRNASHCGGHELEDVPESLDGKEHDFGFEAAEERLEVRRGVSICMFELVKQVN